MQGMLGACACSMCPIQPSSTVVPSEKMKAIVKGLGAGEVTFDEFGLFTLQGRMVDERYRPGKRDMGLDAIIVIMSTESVTLVHPKLYENGMNLLQRYYRHTKRTQDLLKRVQIAPVEEAIPLTFYDVLAWQIMRGPAKSADIAISLTRSMCREAKIANRMSCLLWKRDKKSKNYLAINNMIARLGTKKDPKSLQEDCIRILASLGAGNERIMRLAKIKPLLRALGKTILDGTDKSVDTALWLTWRMTQDAEFCKRLMQNAEMIKALVEVASLEGDSIPGVREENALAILANLSVEEEVCSIFLDRYPNLLISATYFIELGSTRAAELGALLVGNLAFNDAALKVLADVDIAVPRLVSLMISGGDRARELGTLALANLTCLDKIVHQFLGEDGAVEVILHVRESGVTGRAREAAGRIIANVAVHRLKSAGVVMPHGTGKVTSESIFNDTTVKTQNQIKQFGFQKSQSFSTPWSQASVMLTGRFPEIAKRSQSQMSMQSMPSCKFSRLSSLNGLQVSADVSVDTITTNLPPL